MKIRVNAGEYLKRIEPEMPLLGRESREAYLKCLGLLLTITTTILLGFISFAKILGLYNFQYKLLTIITIILLSLAFLSISLAIIIFLLAMGTSLYKLLVGELEAKLALLKREDNIEIDDSRVFINYYMAMIGVILFNFGFANLVLSLYRVLISPLSYGIIILINIIIFAIFMVIFVPFIKKNKKLSIIVKEVLSKMPPSE